MPIHEYECEACGHRFEVIEKFNEVPKRQCPKCKGKLRRLISAPGLQFKGSGWYITDYARKGSVPSDSGESSSESSSSSSSSTEPPVAPKPPARPATRRRATPARRRRR